MRNARRIFLHGAERQQHLWRAQTQRGRSSICAHAHGWFIAHHLQGCRSAASLPSPRPLWVWELWAAELAALASPWNMEGVSSRFSEVPDFGPMLVAASLVVTLPSTAEGRVGEGPHAGTAGHGSAPSHHLLPPCGAMPGAGLVLSRDGARPPSLNLSRWLPSHSQPCTHAKPSPAAL